MFKNLYFVIFVSVIIYIENYDLECTDAGSCSITFSNKQGSILISILRFLPLRCCWSPRLLPQSA